MKAKEGTKCFSDIVFYDKSVNYPERVYDHNKPERGNHGSRGIKKISQIKIMKDFRGAIVCS